MELPRDVQREIQELDRMFRSQRTLSTKLEAVTDLVERIVPRCAGASVSLTVEESMFTGASSSQLAIEADLVQYHSGEGPCLSSVDEQAVIRVDALDPDERFEHFAPGAIELGVESVLSIPLLAGDHVVGSLNLYSRERDAFPDDVPERIAGLIAYAVHLIRTSPLYAASVQTLAGVVEVALQSAQVEIAVGLLMVSRGLGPDEAWEHLQTQATATGRTIVELAQALIEAHERLLDDGGDDPGGGVEG